MAFTRLASTQKLSTNGSSVTTDAINTTGANLIVISVHSVSDAITPTDSYGNTWFSHGSFTGAFELVHTLSCLNPTVGTGHTFSASGAAGRNPVISVAAYSGAHNTASYEAQVGGYGNGTSITTSSSITPSEDGCLLWSGFSMRGGTSAGCSPLANVYSADSTGNSVGAGLAEEIQTTATTRSATWSWTGSIGFPNGACCGLQVFKSDGVSGNTAPVADAGPDQSINLPTDTVTLAGSGTDDGVGSPGSPGSPLLFYLWTKSSGPGTVTFVDATDPLTDATFSQIGTYVLNLNVSDGLLDDDDTMTVTFGGYVSTCSPGAITITGTDATLLEVDAGLAIYIANVNQTARVLWARLNYNLAGAWTADFAVYDADSTSAAYRPPLDAGVRILYQGQLIHKGNITTVRDGPAAASATGVITQCTSKANRIATDQIEVTETYAAGSSLKSIVTDLFNTYIAPNFSGFVLDPTMLTGPTIAETVTFEVTRLQDVFNRLTDLTGWVIRFMPTDVLQCFEPGTSTATYSLTDSNGNAEAFTGGPVTPIVTWEQTRGNFVNRVNLRYGTGTAEKTDNFTGDGSTNSFTLTYPLTGYYPYTSDGAVGYGVVVVSWGTTESVGGPTSPMIWLYNQTTNAITRTTGAPGNGNTFSMTYETQFPQIVTVEDAASIAANGLYERTYTRTDIFDVNEATELATGLLRVNSAAPKIITVPTLQYPMPFPGDAITLSFPNRMITNDSYLITQVQARAVNLRAGVTLEFTFTCVEGLEAHRSWSDLLRSALGSS